MKTAFAAASLAAFLAGPALTSAASAEPAAYEFDKTHTAISASWTHLGYSQMSIYFTDYDGVLLLDFEEPSNSTVDVTFNIADGYEDPRARLSGWSTTT
jgi:polyisoprenoid-binding protein YceI